MGQVVQRIFVQLLSGLDGQLAALCLRPALGDASELDAVSELGELAQKFPCVLLESDIPVFGEAALAALSSAGCRTVADAQLAQPESAEALSALNRVSYVRGAWYLQPLAKPIKDQTGSRALALKLLQLVVAEAETREIEEIFRREPTLSYHLLRLVNSPAIGSGRKIDSFAQAIMVLGRRQLRRWLNLLLFTARKDDPRTAMLLARVTLRARLLERVTHELGEDRDAQERAFMVGMFSMLGLTFGLPLEEVLKPLGLDAEIQAALLSRSGDLGQQLAAIEAYESGDCALASSLLAGRVPNTLALDALCAESCLWVLSLIGGSNG